MAAVFIFTIVEIATLLIVMAESLGNLCGYFKNNGSCRLLYLLHIIAKLIY